jgi:hypothetical protein
VSQGCKSEHEALIVANPTPLAEGVLKAEFAAGTIERQNMRLKKLGTALVVVLALGAVMAGNAFAGVAFEEAATWRTGEAGTVLSGSESVTSTGSGELITKVGETPLVLKSTGLECIECTIKNEEREILEGEKKVKKSVAVGNGKLKFTGVTVASPSACAVSGGSVTTVPLEVTAYFMNTRDFIKEGKEFTELQNWVLFHPASGNTFATVTLTKGTGTCPISGSYIVSGTVFVKSNNSTGVYAVNQTVTSSGTLNAEAGGSLKFGEASAELNGTGTFSLSGAKKGEVFGTHN